MWQGLRTICSFGNKSSAEVGADPLLAEELNVFYGRFECNGGSATLPISASGSGRQSSVDHALTVSEDVVRRELKRVNVRKAAGPDGITGRVLRLCMYQLAGLFTSIFKGTFIHGIKNVYTFENCYIFSYISISVHSILFNFCFLFLYLCYIPFLQCYSYVCLHYHACLHYVYTFFCTGSSCLQDKFLVCVNIPVIKLF